MQNETNTIFAESYNSIYKLLWQQILVSKVRKEDVCVIPSYSADVVNRSNILTKSYFKIKI